MTQENFLRRVTMMALVDGMLACKPVLVRFCHQVFQRGRSVLASADPPSRIYSPIPRWWSTKKDWFPPFCLQRASIVKEITVVIKYDMYPFPTSDSVRNSKSFSRGEKMDTCEKIIQSPVLMNPGLGFIIQSTLLINRLFLSKAP